MFKQRTDCGFQIIVLRSVNAVTGLYLNFKTTHFTENQRKLVESFNSGFALEYKLSYY